MNTACGLPIVRKHPMTLLDVINTRNFSEITDVLFETFRFCLAQP